ncbi:MAG TPA: PstS family phosphate ABC transporter substrate-binding protein [Candidatus Cloacimonadota bacterium]|nr:PstS family phosphate ABC transporter substrate-binding protein [Candidatus Cloacimonadota bacterium]
MKRMTLIILALLMIFMSLSAKNSNQLTCSGSTTVLPIAQAAAEAFMAKYPDINISVRGGGSGVGIAALISGSVDIANSSRPMKSKELLQAKSKGVNPVAYFVANDGIAVIVNNSNPIKGLTLKQLKGIYTGKITNWNQLGGKNLPIVVISRDVASGTFEVFNEKALQGSMVIDSALMLASNNAVVSTVGDTPGAVGYIGLGYINDKVHTLSIENIVPTETTIKDMSYKLSRKLYMYTNGKASGNAAKFIAFIQSAEGQKIVRDTGFIPLN